MTRHLLPAALRAGAAGLLAPEAAVNLLIGHRYWLTRPGFAGEYIDTFPGITDGTAMAAVCWPEAVAALDRGPLSGSGSETRTLRLAASLAAGIPVVLPAGVSGPELARALTEGEVSVMVGVPRLEAICHVDHTPSANVLEKCGFIREDSRRAHFTFPNLAPQKPSAVNSYALALQSAV